MCTNVSWPMSPEVGHAARALLHARLVAELATVPLQEPPLYRCVPEEASVVREALVVLRQLLQPPQRETAT